MCKAHKMHGAKRWNVKNEAALKEWERIYVANVFEQLLARRIEAIMSDFESEEGGAIPPEPTNQQFDSPVWLSGDSTGIVNQFL